MNPLFSLFDFSTIDLRNVIEIEDGILAPLGHYHEAVYYVHLRTALGPVPQMIYESRKYTDDLKRLPMCPRDTLVNALRIFQEQQT